MFGTCTSVYRCITKLHTLRVITVPAACIKWDISVNGLIFTISYKIRETISDYTAATCTVEYICSYQHWSLVSGPCIVLDALI